MRATPNITLQEFSNRRIQSVQRSIHKAFQSPQKAFEVFPTQDHTDWYTYSTGSRRPMESSWNIGLGPETGNKSDKVPG